VAACWALAIAPTSRTVDMNARIPQRTSDLEAHTIDGNDIAIRLAQVADRDGGWHDARP
jgi:hypothetical protein